MVANTTFSLSSKVSERMSVQSFQNKSSCQGTMWIDSGTNVSTMGRSFKMVEYTDRLANMTGFSNDLVKNDIPIGSGFTNVV